MIGSIGVARIVDKTRENRLKWRGGHVLRREETWTVGVTKEMVVDGRERGTMKWKMEDKGVRPLTVVGNKAKVKKKKKLPIEFGFPREHHRNRNLRSSTERPDRRINRCGEK